MGFVSKKNILIAVAAAFLIVTGFLVWNFKFRKVVISNEFTGRMLSVENNSIFAEGMFVMPKGSVPADNPLIKVEFVVSGQTQIKQIEKSIPPEIKPGDVFRFGDLPTQETLVDLETLEQDLASYSLDFRAKSDKNIYGKNKIYPFEIKYLLPIFK